MIKLQYKGIEIPYKLCRAKIKNLYIYIKEGEVIVKAPVNVENKKIEDFLNKKSKWIYDNLNKSKENMKKEAQEKIEKVDLDKLKKLVEQNIYKYSKKLNVVPEKVRIRDLKYAWGSCSSNKNISINLKLAKKNEKVVEYVVLHEMCHLIYMNHSKNFWNLVEKYMPEYKEYKKLLA